MAIPMPPTAELVERLYQFALPAAGGAALLCCMFSLAGRRLDALGAAVAIIGAFLWANFRLPEPVPEWERTEATEFEWAKTGRPLPWTPSSERPQAYHWLPRAALVLLIVGLLTHWLSHCLPERRFWLKLLATWLPRLGAVAVVSTWLVADRWTERHGIWLIYALAAAMIAEWIVLESASQIGSISALCQAMVFLAASLLFVYHQWPTPAEIAIILGFGMLGLAIASAAARTATLGAVPATVAFLPALLLAGWEQQESRIPVESFWLIALAPLSLTPFLVPRLRRLSGLSIRIVQIALTLIPLSVAIFLIVKHQPAPF